MIFLQIDYRAQVKIHRQKGQNLTAHFFAVQYLY